MGTREQLTEDMKAAMRAKETVRLDTIRGVRGAVTQAEVDGGKDLDEAGILDVIRKLRKQRVESIEQYTEGGREDLAAREREEKAILEAYLPAGPDEATIAATVSAIIEELSASGMKDMGKVMAAAKGRLAGADGKTLSSLVRAKLNAGG